MKKPLQLKQVLAALLTIAALASGLTAQATVQTGIMMQGQARTVNNQTMCTFVIQSNWGGDQIPVQTGSSYTFSNATMIHGTVDVTLNGTLNFQQGTAMTDVITATSFTVTIESSSLWFYGAMVQTKSGANVTGCTVTTSSNHNTLTVTIPQGKTFGAVILDYVSNPPMTNSNTTVTVPQGNYWVSNSNHKPQPEPTVVYGGQTILVKDTDYTLSWSNNSSAGTGTVTVTGIGNYAGSATGFFYIRWAIYYVHFDKNHDDATGTMSVQLFTYNTAQALTDNTFSRTGYSFIGWSTTSNGAVTYTDGQNVSNLTAEDGQTVTLYAQWVPITYNISYDLAGGSVTTANPTTYNIETATFTLNNPTRTGYTFAGWTGSNGTTPQTTVTINQGSIGDRSFTANWAPITYNISYDLAGGSVATANPTTYNIETATFTLNNPTREHYTFAGWTGTDLDEPTMNVTIAQGSIGDRNYTATWDPIPYNLTYNLAGGSVATANPTTYTVETPTFTLNNPTKVACNFDGWTGSNGDTPETTVTIAQGSTGDRSYTAQWTQYAYPLSLGTDITASGTVAFTYEGTDYFTPGTIITLAYGGTIPEGYRPLYSVNGNAIVGNTFEMPTADVVVDAVLLERYYTFNSTTGVLALLWGEFNRYNKWGSEVIASAVTSVTATDEVSFTGDCSHLFQGFTNCTSMDLTDVNTANVTDMKYMFYGCYGLQSLNISGWNTANVINMSEMFQYCYSLQSLDLSGWNTANVTDMSYIFNRCSGLQLLNISGWNTANVTNMSSMFEDCVGLQSLDLSDWSTANVTNMSSMFENCSGLQSLDLSGWNTANVTTMERMFWGCSSLTTLDLSGWNTANVSDMSQMFYGCSALQSLDLSGWNTANVTYMSDMFYGCSGLPSLDLSGWNTDNVTNMNYMFYGCSGLQSLDVSGWNTDNVTYMNYMFYGCSGLQSLDVSGWNTANVTDMSWMFQQCSSLQSLDLSGWNTAKVTNMSHMFRNCSGLPSLDLSGWNTDKVISMGYMFYGCSDLQSLNVSGWNTAKVAYMAYMFQNCSGLTTIYVGSGWSTSSVGSSNSLNMFRDCASLVGGMGTAYDANHIDKEYARIDRGQEQPGYFTGRFTKEIAGYGNDENPGGYYLIASPVGTVNPENVGNMTANAFDLYRFNQSADLEWENWKDQDDGGYDLVSGKGYLYANSDDVTLTFTGTPVEGDTYEVTLTRDDNAEFAGWNLVGNPFTKTAYIMGDVAFYTMNEAGSELEACTSLTSIAPMEGVFVLANTDGETLTFTTEEPSKKGEMMAINLCGGGVSTLRQAQGPRTAILDRAIVRFDDGGVLPKLQIRKDNTKVYIPIDGKEYAVVNMGRDAARHVSTIDVNFKAAENGEYTIAVNAEGVMFNYLHLIDNITGMDVDLLHPNTVIAGEASFREGGTQSPTPTYTFTAKTTDYESRFRLVFSTSGDANGDNEAFAFVDASGNIIITDGPSTGSGTCTLQVIDVMGRVIFSRDAARHVSTSGMAPGVYVLRLINGDDVRTQKIIID